MLYLGDVFETQGEEELAPGGNDIILKLKRYKGGSV